MVKLKEENDIQWFKAVLKFTRGTENLEKIDECYVRPQWSDSK